jgi:hypothetical protein
VIVGLPLDLEWTLLEGWGYKVPWVRKEGESAKRGIFGEEVRRWDSLHLSSRDRSAQASVVGGGYEDSFYSLDDRLEENRQKALASFIKKPDQLVLIWPSILDRLSFRAGVFYSSQWSKIYYTFRDWQTPVMGVILSHIHGYSLGSNLLNAARCEYDFWGEVSTKRMGQTIRSKILSSQNFVFSSKVGPTFSLECPVSNQVFILRLFIQESPLVSLRLVLDRFDSREEIEFDIEKDRLRPKWLENLDIKDRDRIYYFYLDPSFDGNLDSLWEGESKTVNGSRGNVILEVEVEDPIEVLVRVAFVKLNLLNQSHGQSGLSVSE